VTLAERLHAAMTAAMREHEDVRRDALRMALAALQRAEKDARHPLSADEEIGVLTREIRTRRESVDAFARGGRRDLAAAEQAKLDALDPYMPSQLGDDEIEALIQAAIDETGAVEPRDLGRVMKVLAPRVRGRADGRQIHSLVSRELARRTSAARR
jgi:uncharacterized protein